MANQKPNNGHRWTICEQARDSEWENCCLREEILEFRSSQHLKNTWAPGNESKKTHQPKACLSRWFSGWNFPSLVGDVTVVPWRVKKCELPSLKLTVRPWKWMVGILLSYWGIGLFSGTFWLVSGSVTVTIKELPVLCIACKLAETRPCICNCLNSEETSSWDLEAKRRDEFDEVDPWRFGILNGCFWFP